MTSELGASVTPTESTQKRDGYPAPQGKLTSGVRTRTTLAILAAAAGLALAAPAAQADKVTATITPVGPGEANYTGKVKARRDTCAKNRIVEVYDMSQGGFYIAGA